MNTKIRHAARLAGQGRMGYAGTIANAHRDIVTIWRQEAVASAFRQIVIKHQHQLHVQGNRKPPQQTMNLNPGEGIVLSDATGMPVIILDPSMNGLPTISLQGGSFGGEICIQIDDGRPRIIFRRPDGKDGLYISCQGSGEVITFCNSTGFPVLRVGFDADSNRVLLEQA